MISNYFRNENVGDNKMGFVPKMQIELFRHGHLAKRTLPENCLLPKFSHSSLIPHLKQWHEESNEAVLFQCFDEAMCRGGESDYCLPEMRKMDNTTEFRYQITLVLRSGNAFRLLMHTNSILPYYQIRVKLKGIYIC